MNTKYSLTIGWLYPELMSTYGDRGNIITLEKRCQWRGIKLDIRKLDIGYSEKQLAKCDLLFMGGAQDKQQTIVGKDLKQKVKSLGQMIENGAPGLYVCGAYQFLGKYYKEADGTSIDGLGILDLHTENPGPRHPRLIGNMVLEINQSVILGTNKARTPESDSGQARTTKTIVGFENHGGRTYLGKNLQPFGKVIVGFGNNGEDKTEGAIYKNSFGTYSHGPILPKNPHFADLLIKLALEKKYQTRIELPTLDDSLEYQAREFILNTLQVS